MEDHLRILVVEDNRALAAGLSLAAVFASPKLLHAPDLRAAVDLIPGLNAADWATLPAVGG